MKITLDVPEKFDKPYTEHDIKMFIAVSLYEKEILASGYCAQMIGMDKHDFILEMGKYGESIFDMTEEEIERDLTYASQFVR